MTTLEMEIALMSFLNIRQNIVVPNVYWGIRGLYYECDIVKLTKSNYATEIEIKVSKSDLLRDGAKEHGHYSDLFKYFYFAVPKELEEVALQNIPKRAGLYVVKNVVSVFRDKPTPTVYTIRKAKKQQCRQWTDQDRIKLASLGAMRVLGLKEKLLELQEKFDRDRQRM